MKLPFPFLIFVSIFRAGQKLALQSAPLLRFLLISTFSL